MPTYDHTTKTITVKLVYYGAPMSGKSTSMAAIHQHLRPDLRRGLQSEATETHRIFFFHFTPDDPSPVTGYAVQVHVVTVPGAVWSAATRLASLDHVDGVVFVADSQPDQLQRTRDYLQEMGTTILATGRLITTLPVVLQYTKRDIPNVLPVTVMDNSLNLLGWPRFESQMIGPWREPGWQSERLVGAVAPFHALYQQVVQQLTPNT